MTFSKCSSLRADICSKVVALLDKRAIDFSSVDLARFRWTEDEEGAEEKEDAMEEEDAKENTDFDYTRIQDPTYGKVVTTAATVWVGVLPDTLTSEIAHASSKDILQFLEEHGIYDVEVAFRESTRTENGGPQLLAPVSDVHPLKDAIYTLTTALGLPIAGLNSLNNAGTLGFYFRVGEDLYAVTARHVLFNDNEPNEEYAYNGTFFSMRR